MKFERENIDVLEKTPNQVLINIEEASARLEEDIGNMDLENNPEKAIGATRIIRKFTLKWGKALLILGGAVLATGIGMEIIEGFKTVGLETGGPAQVMQVVGTITTLVGGARKLIWESENSLEEAIS
ncbi:hypothetical protein A2995_00285 [Candidatus Nomurabacteria bacterium RIFCSPLOWO2_01_FULL_33_24]|uniref:Uncharacterized protein n=1 Tax=Candidatus Nomurabacteria bacterium RIFCSPLOWO2_01_FULL_33_24 TaxID=1801765 RepID=A0A1F6X218_9BACT|nr:MAG: hypothetical protein A2995_00285 [Candidatus Nomurabacteria bacterium RIFCSPLOWO2_01_FULL_33_24]